MFRRMIRELDEHYGGLKKFIVIRLIHTYIAVSLCIGFVYLLNHWLLKEITTFLLILPLVTLIALPAYWYLDIKPITDKQHKG